MFGLMPAPGLGCPDLQWFNVAQPLSLADLRGRLVILDFWTPCCVNCLQALPTLNLLQKTYCDRLIIIGVTSPKYPAERDPEAVAHAIARHDIRHPVVHDPDLTLWRAYDVSAWPTLVFIDPEGNILGQLQGEPQAERLISGTGEMIRSWRRTDTAPLPPLPLTVPAQAAGALRFPGKIKPLIRPGGPKQWAVADTGHHQIVVFGDDGEEVARYGRGQPGFADLGADDSAFRAPEGLVCDARFIYVADTGNHAIRRIDLAGGGVTTLAGTGARGPALSRPLAGRDASLASVWDLEILGDDLFFANAGTHQIGAVDLASGIVRPLAGGAGEDLIDGDASRALLAQPSGLALDPQGRALYFTDSEASAVRRLSLCAAPKVETIVGAGLFDFGSADGDLADARMQHCLGLAWWADGLIVADTYNSQLRLIDLERHRVSRLSSGGHIQGPGLSGGEPAGVTADGADRLLVSDTNHHRIIEICMRERRARAWAA
ncbi:MAG: thioredoxin-like domain-containing protein [Rhodospirillales bacterium]